MALVICFVLAILCILPLISFALAKTAHHPLLALEAFLKFSDCVLEHFFGVSFHLTGGCNDIKHFFLVRGTHEIEKFFFKAANVFYLNAIGVALNNRIDTDYLFFYRHWRILLLLQDFG